MRPRHGKTFLDLPGRGQGAILRALRALAINGTPAKVECPMKTISILALGFLLPLALVGQDLDAKLQNLQKVGEEFAAASAMGSASEPLRAIAGEYRDFSSNFSSLQSYMQDGNYEQSIRIIQRWLARTKNEQVKAALTDLLAAMKKEKEARDAKTSARVDEILKSASRQLASAQSPEQSANVQIQLEEFRDFELNTGDRSSRILNDRISRAINFLSNWQQVLVSEEAGDLSSALQALSNLRRNSSSNPLLDSEAVSEKYQTLLAALMKQNEPRKDPTPIARIIAQTMEKVKSPADAEAAAMLMASLSSFTSGDENRLANSLQSNLSDLVRLNNDFESGAYARVISGSGGSSYFTPYTQQIEKLKESLRRKAVEAANDLPGLGSPKEGEGFSSFIRRMAVEAFEKKDWERLYTLLSVYSSVTGGGCARTADMKEGVAAFLAAQQLEQAGQFGDAVASYSVAVAQLGKLVPRAESAAALARLRKDHPEAFNPTGNIPRLK